MRAPVHRVLISGLAGGVALNGAILLTFRLLGFGWYGGGILLEPSRQSKKLIMVWTEIEPLPRVVSDPLPVMAGLLAFGVLHAFIYSLLSGGWPEGIWRRGLLLTLLLFSACYLFWEFFTPYNLFGEPFGLILLELCLWAIVAAAESFTIVAVMERLGMERP